MQSVTSNATFKACSPNYSQKQLIFEGTTEYNDTYTAPDNGVIVASGWGTSQANNYIIFNVNGVVAESQGNTSEAISVVIPVRKNDTVSITMFLASNNYGCYFIPYN